MDRVINLLGNTYVIVAFTFLGWSVGTFQGYKWGFTSGRDTVMCVMDRIANSNGARGRTEYCKRVDAERDQRK